MLDFGDEACREVARAGGKGASLARMSALGLPVPPGFVVPAECLAAALPDGGAALRAALPGPRARAGDRRRRRGRRPRSPRRTRRWETTRRSRCASSACAEDSETASYAGQQETYLHVRGAGAVLERVRDCWASFFSERAIFYRQRKGSLDDLGMAVVVQRMVRADVAGVLFTCDPVQRRRDRMVVEAVLGLGEAAVSGQVTPDHYVLKRDGTVKRAQIAAQPFAIVPVEAGGTEERELTARRGRRAEARRGPAARARPHRRRPRAAARRPAGHRVGARGRRDLRAPGAAGDHVTELLDRAQAWIAEVHPHARHLERTLDWLLRARPRRVGGAADRGRHARHRARVPGRRGRLGLRARLGLARVQPLAPGPLRRPRRARPASSAAPARTSRARSPDLVRVHEDGGWPEADLAAGGRLAVVPGDDGPGRRSTGSQSGRAPRDARRGQAAPHASTRISPDLPRARELAEALLAPALSRAARRQRARRGASSWRA